MPVTVPMPRDQPHPLALFSLIPMNERSKTILEYPRNSHLVSLIPDAADPSNKAVPEYGLNIGYNIASKRSHILATLGRLGDVIIPAPNVSKIQCSFEIHPTAREIILYDLSSNESTQTFGPKRIPLVGRRRDRHVLVADGVNTEFGFGGTYQNLYHFRIHWHQYKFDIEEQIRQRDDDPLYAKTINDETGSTLPTRPITRIHARRYDLDEPTKEGTIRYYKKKPLGNGSFGEVWKAVDVDTAEAFALKIVRVPDVQSPNFQLLKQEVEALRMVNHPHIIDFVGVQGHGGTHLEIFTHIKEGNVNELVNKYIFEFYPGAANDLLRQMLQALDYLTCRSIIHRDVKPANILFTTLATGNYTFQLTDFGLCDIDAYSYVGSPQFMAPEVLAQQGTVQTSKVDIWSLFVTLAYTVNAAGYRQKPLNTNHLKIRAVQEAGNTTNLKHLQEMIALDPDERASAAEMLVKVFDGDGLTTPRNLVKDITKAKLKAVSEGYPRRRGRHSLGAISKQKRTTQSASAHVSLKRRSMLFGQDSKTSEAMDITGDSGPTLRKYNLRSLSQRQDDSENVEMLDI